MKNRKLGQIQVSPIGMGCMGFSHGYGRVPEESYSVEAIRKAYEDGCTFFDTAESYGKEQFYPGHNEELVGKAVESFRKQAVVATKFHITNAEMEAQGFHLYQAIRRITKVLFAGQTVKKLAYGSADRAIAPVGENNSLQ